MCNLLTVPYSKVKNYTYKRYSGIKSLDRLTPAYDIMGEVRRSGLRTQLGLPSAYFSPAVIDAVADIKGMWGMLKNKRRRTQEGFQCPECGYSDTPGPQPYAERSRILPK